MTNPDSKTNETKKEKIKRYLYNEMTNDERERFEENFFADDELFFQIVETENELVDFYARGRLPESELARFERSLKNSPERQAKVANAVAMQTFIAEERPAAAVAAATISKQTFGQKLAEFFSFKTPAFGYAMAGLFVLFAVSSAFLLLDSRRKDAEIARLQIERNNEQAVLQKQVELENQIAESRNRETDLKTQIDDERETSGDLTDELESERERRERIEAELERLRREKSIQPAPKPPQQQTPIIASIFLSPLTTRGGSSIAPRFAVERGTKRIIVRLALPDKTKTGERFSVFLNDKIAARDLAARQSAVGQKSVQLTVALSDLIVGSNSLRALDETGREIVKYDFFAREK